MLAALNSRTIAKQVRSLVSRVSGIMELDLVNGCTFLGNMLLTVLCRKAWTYLEGFTGSQPLMNLLMLKLACRNKTGLNFKQTLQNPKHPENLSGYAPAGGWLEWHRFAIVALGSIWIEDAVRVSHCDIDAPRDDYGSMVFSSPTGACDCRSGFGRRLFPEAAPGSTTRSRVNTCMRLRTGRVCCLYL